MTDDTKTFPDWVNAEGTGSFSKYHGGGGVITAPRMPYRLCAVR